MKRNSDHDTEIRREHRSGLRRYLRRILLFFAPFLLVLALYFVLDPFKVLRDYERYYISGTPDYVVLNRSHVSTETFLHGHPRHGYDSFIFGNSRSLFFRAADWRRHIGKDASVFHFDGSDESLFTLHRKVKFLREHNVPMRHALLVVDHSVLYWAEERQGHLIATPPRLMQWSNLLTFHGSFLLAYLDPRFLLAYYDFMLFGTFRDYMRDHNVLNAEPMIYDASTNEVSYPQFDRAIVAGRYYTDKRMKPLHRGVDPPVPYVPCLGTEHTRLLRELQRWFSAAGTEVRVIVSPLYNQRSLHPQDVRILKSVFGETRVFDFSGVNPITADYRNYYEASHYRPSTAAALLDSVYTTNQ